MTTERKHDRAALHLCALLSLAPATATAGGRRAPSSRVHRPRPGRPMRRSRSARRSRRPPVWPGRRSSRSSRCPTRPPRGASPAPPTSCARSGAPGSGAIVDASGYIVTNAHVVRGAQRIRVEVPTVPTGGSILAARGRVLDGRIVGPRSGDRSRGHQGRGDRPADAAGSATRTSCAPDSSWSRSVARSGSTTPCRSASSARSHASSSRNRRWSTCRATPPSARQQRRTRSSICRGGSSASTRWWRRARAPPATASASPRRATSCAASTSRSASTDTSAAATSACARRR